MKILDGIILFCLFFLIFLLVKSTYDYHYKFECANEDTLLQSEPFVDDYYSFNWVSPTLIGDINLEKIYMSGGGCSCLNTKNGCSRCTYSMSCDYTDDSSNPRCFAGYDRPGDGDLDIPPFFRDIDHNQSI
jgi:hypothetical protein